MDIANRSHRRKYPESEVGSDNSEDHLPPRLGSPEARSNFVVCEDNEDEDDIDDEPNSDVMPKNADCSIHNDEEHGSQHWKSINPRGATERSISYEGIIDNEQNVWGSVAH